MIQEPKAGIMSNPRRHAFTLVELLVVITVVMVLLAFLLPTMLKAKQASLAIRCGSNLKQWGIGLASYTNDQKGNYPPAWGPVFQGVYPYAYRVHTASDAYLSGAAAPVVISLEMMGSYLGGVPGNLNVAPTAPQQALSGVWRCPAAFDDLDDINASQWTSLGWVYGDYSYFGRSDLWTTANGFQANEIPFPNDIMQNEARSDRLLMGDVCFRWTTLDGRWTFNHYAGNLSSVSHVTGVPWIGPPELSGLNGLYGDGHVFWKGAGMFDPVLMDSCTAGTGSRFVKSGTGGSTFDATFY